MASRVQCVAHRGGADLAPENTLAAFRKALTFAADAVEVDVQVSRDGQLVIFHDNTVDRLTDATGNILDLDFAFLRSLNVAAHFPGWPTAEQMPTLREVLDVIKGRAEIYVELKTSKRDGILGRYPHIMELVLADLYTTDMLKETLIISFDWQMLAEIKRLEPAIATGMLTSDNTWKLATEQDLTALLAKVETLKCGWLDMEYKQLKPEIVPVLHAQGVKLGIWDANTEDEIRSCIEAGVDSITTDRPDLVALCLQHTAEM
uniref:Glycerophosphoryl diester phosphodiesterase n=1 Tax=Thermosporothrix sp. COM3 TaxID=2490863 RepID=A0A455SVI7_9CHLR|nr:glycerophosphoryl diester phosphodiesterase [Thermosporothrix sp. COM3]